MIINPKAETGLKIARTLIEAQAILVAQSGKAPFTLTSGRKSPVYIDGKKLISYPEHRKKIISEIVTSIQTRGLEFDYIGGIESGSIAYAAWVAEALDAPMIYLRKKPKGFGKQAQIEGEFKPGSKVLMVEDVTSDGQSKVTFTEVLRQSGGVVEDIFTIFFYNSFDYTEQILQKADIHLHYLSSWPFVLEMLAQESDFSQDTLSDITNFLRAPDEWNA